MPKFDIEQKTALYYKINQNMVDQLKWNKIGVYALKLSKIREMAENYRKLSKI